jgi:hypothetical protein
MAKILLKPWQQLKNYWLLGLTYSFLEVLLLPYFIMK